MRSVRTARQTPYGSSLGPRMAVATLALFATGGHGDMSGFSPYLHFETASGIADGVDEIRKRVRTNIKFGADLIKVAAGAGVLSEEESVGAPQYSQEELNALVQEATMWGRKVAAHAHGAEAIKRAIKTGVKFAFGTDADFSDVDFSVVALE